MIVDPSRPVGSPRRALRGVAMAAALGLALAVASPSAADDYEADRAGHPVRILAYVLHPFGVVLDYLVMRPAHWLGHHEPFQTLFGHEEH
jgi:hypothetical protein